MGIIPHTERAWRSRFISPRARLPSSPIQSIPGLESAHSIPLSLLLHHSLLSHLSHFPRPAHISMGEASPISLSSPLAALTSSLSLSFSFPFPSSHPLLLLPPIYLSVSTLSAALSFFFFFSFSFTPPLLFSFSTLLDLASPFYPTTTTSLIQLPFSFLIFYTIDP